MNRTSFLAVAGFLAVAHLHAASVSKLPAIVPVCIAHTANVREAAEALSLASFIFRGVDVSIAWHRGFEGCETGSIRIDVSENTPRHLHPGAIAYAFPYAGFQTFAGTPASATADDIHIRIFYDRIEAMGERLASKLFAHTLIHEITHVLQGVTQHAKEGMMKAKWTHNDYAAMLRRQLILSREDVDLLHRGIAMREKVAEDEKAARPGVFWPVYSAGLGRLGF